MQTTISRHRGRLALIILAGIVCITSAAHAGSAYGDKHFAVRLAPAFIRFTEVSALGGETVANRFSSAINPASTAWTEIPGHGVVVAPYYSRIHFQNGTNLDLYGESITYDTKKYGTFQPTLSQIRSNEETHRLGLDFDYNVDTFQLQWGKRFDNFAVGATFNFAEADIIQDGLVLAPVPPIGLVPTFVRSHGEAESYRFRLGGLYEPCEKWLIGAIVEYGFAPWRSRVMTTVLDPPIMMKTHESGTQHQFLFRPGVSYEYAERSTVFLDYAFGSYVHQAGQLKSHRFSAGVDHQLLPFLFVRVAGSVDVRGNARITCGLTAFFAEWGSVELGYQYNMLPELRPEFGRAQAIQAALSLRF